MQNKYRTCILSTFLVHAIDNLHCATGGNNETGISIFYKFLANNTNLSTVSGLREALWHETMFPQALKTLSDGELVVGTHRYFLANFANLAISDHNCKQYSRDLMTEHRLAE